MIQFEVNPIGSTGIDENGYYLQIDEPYRKALKGLKGFSHVVVVWWFDGFDSEEFRSMLSMQQPYRLGPEELGIFATRSPIRPNPIALTTTQILDMDENSGRIAVPYMDANPGSPILDIKPYTPSCDRVEMPEVPQWCAHWPKSYEVSGDFDWENEMLNH